MEFVSRNRLSIQKALSLACMPLYQAKGCSLVYWSFKGVKSLTGDPGGAGTGGVIQEKSNGVPNRKKPQLYRNGLSIQGETQPSHTKGYFKGGSIQRETFILIPLLYRRKPSHHGDGGWIQEKTDGLPLQEEPYGGPYRGKSQWPIYTGETLRAYVYRKEPV